MSSALVVALLSFGVAWLKNVCYQERR